MKRRLPLLLAALCLSFFTAAGASLFWVRGIVNQPASAVVGTQEAPRMATLTVKRGSTLRPLLEELASQGVLKSPSVVYAYARYSRDVRVKTGTYEVLSSQSPKQILEQLHEGRVVLKQFTIAEGLNRWQIRDLLASAQWMSQAKFDALCNDSAFLKQHKIPGPTCEGYLYPETYKFAQGTPAEAIMATMFGAWRRQMFELLPNGRVPESLPMELSIRELVTLASIVEKETGAAEERPRIACVFYNRLKAKPAWKLETDPTVIYAATLADPKFDGNIKSYHLHKLSNPYNTYRNFGLPPGPIASPGGMALKAVLAPADCRDFFFVSKNHGRHVFCPTLRCHKKAVKTYQIDYFKKAKPPRKLERKGSRKRPLSESAH